MKPSLPVIISRHHITSLSGCISVGYNEYRCHDIENHLERRQCEEQEKRFKNASTYYEEQKRLKNMSEPSIHRVQHDKSCVGLWNGKPGRLLKVGIQQCNSEHLSIVRFTAGCLVSSEMKLVNGRGGLDLEWNYRSLKGKATTDMFGVV